MTRAGFAVAAIVLNVTVAVALREGYCSAQAQTQIGSPEATIWDHNGSVMCLVTKGSSREIYYQKPRPGMLEAGARSGSLLFRGEVNNGQYLGTAYIFNAHCGPIPFEVKGSILDDDERIVLTGQAPRVSQNCRTYGSYASTLEFRRAKLDEANRFQGALTTAAPPAIASKPELKADVSPMEGREVPSPPTAEHPTRNETPSTPKDSSPGLVDSTGVGTTSQISVPNDAKQAKDLNKYYGE
jgi:hypothetical protein